MKYAHDYSHAKSVTAWGLLYQGKEAGKLIANWSDNPAGSVCAATVWVSAGPLAEWYYSFPKTGRARGYGYDKLSAAVASAFIAAGVQPRALESAGNGQTREEFEAWGYTVIRVLG